MNFFDRFAMCMSAFSLPFSLVFMCIGFGSLSLSIQNVSLSLAVFLIHIMLQFVSLIERVCVYIRILFVRHYSIYLYNDAVDSIFNKIDYCLMLMSCHIFTYALQMLADGCSVALFIHLQHTQFRMYRAFHCFHRGFSRYLSIFVLETSSF